MAGIERQNIFRTSAIVILKQACFNTLIITRAGPFHAKSWRTLTTTVLCGVVLLYTCTDF
jgi:hypothetical protein